MVEIDLLATSFTPGHKQYERVHRAFTTVLAGAFQFRFALDVDDARTLSFADGQPGRQRAASHCDGPRLNGG